MHEYFTMLAIALLPALGNVIGSLLAESTRTPGWVVGAALHGAAGIAIAVVSVGLMPRILDETPTGLLVASFLGGAVFSVILAHSIDWLRAAFGKGSAGAWMVYAAVAADLLSDGLATGAGSAIGGGLGLLLGLTQVIANIPGGFAAIANFRRVNVERRSRLLIAASFVVPVLVGASLGFWLLRDSSTAVQHAALAFMVGVLLLATVEDTVPQADEPGAERWISTIAFAGGFALFTLLASYIEQ